MPMAHMVAGYHLKESMLREDKAEVRACVLRGLGRQGASDGRVHAAAGMRGRQRPSGHVCTQTGDACVRACMLACACMCACASTGLEQRCVPWQPRACFCG